MVNLKTLERWAQHQSRGQTRHCEVEGCGVATREGKPYCSEHVERHPYVRQVLAQLVQRESEEARVFDQGARAVDPAGITAQEILQFIRLHGPRTVPRLARELNLEVKTVTGYVRALERRKVVDTDTTRRGALIVRLHETRTRKRRSKVASAKPQTPPAESSQNAA
jgi:DNA-binding MarR family transcriptional regulator